MNNKQILYEKTADDRASTFIKLYVNILSVKVIRKKIIIILTLFYKCQRPSDTTNVFI